MITSGEVGGGRWAVGNQERFADGAQPYLPYCPPPTAHRPPPTAHRLLPTTHRNTPVRIGVLLHEAAGAIEAQRRLIVGLDLDPDRLVTLGEEQRDDLRQQRPAVAAPLLAGMDAERGDVHAILLGDDA